MNPHNTFEAVWKDIKLQLGTKAEGLPDKDVLWKWWPTTKDTTPDIEMLAVALMNFGYNPYISLLTIYCVGYSQGLEDVMEEKVWPHAQGNDESRVPGWLDNLILETLVTKYGDNH